MFWVKLGFVLVLLLLDKSQRDNKSIDVGGFCFQGFKYRKIVKFLNRFLRFDSSGVIFFLFLVDFQEGNKVLERGNESRVQFVLEIVGILDSVIFLCYFGFRSSRMIFMCLRMIQRQQRDIRFKEVIKLELGSRYFSGYLGDRIRVIFFSVLVNIQEIVFQNLGNFWRKEG